MTKKTKTAQPQPQPEAPDALVAQSQGEEGQANTVVPFIPSGTASGPNAADIRNMRVSKAYQAKSATVGQIVEKLKASASLSMQGEDKAEEAQQTAAEAGLLLYQARVGDEEHAPVLTDDEITAHIGQIFGFRLKGDASKRVPAGDQKASKTPYGMGAAIQKRVFRAVKATEYVRTGVPPAAFFQPIEVEAIQPLLTELRNGTMTVWQVYDRLSKLKSDAGNNRPAPAFDASRVTAMTATLAKSVETSVQAMLSDADLFEAWAENYAVIGAIFADERLIAKAQAA